MRFVSNVHGVTLLVGLYFFLGTYHPMLGAGLATIIALSQFISDNYVEKELAKANVQLRDAIQGAKLRNATIAQMKISHEEANRTIAELALLVQAIRPVALSRGEMEPIRGGWTGWHSRALKALMKGGGEQGT